MGLGLLGDRGGGSGPVIFRAGMVGSGRGVVRVVGESDGLDCITV
jgi:hypothetical protein